MDINTLMAYFGYVAAFVAFLKGMQYLIRLTPIGANSSKIKQHETWLKNDKAAIDELRSDIISIKADLGRQQVESKRTNESLNKIARSLISLLNHMVSGNGIEQMKEEAEDLTDFFIGHNN